jgi:hypothetical protein
MRAQVAGLCWTALLEGNESGKHGQERLSGGGGSGREGEGDKVKEDALDE